MTRNTLSLTQTIKLVTCALNSDTPIHLIGSPGIGKTAILAQIAKSLGVPLYTLILAQSMPEDLGGIPDRRGDEIVRLPIGPIARACKVPGILFLDEFSQANAPLQGASLRLINERDAGDVKLHPDTRIVLASNPSAEAASGNDITPPALNRMTHVYVRPTARECQDYFNGLGAQGSALQALAVDFSATTEVSPELFVMEPPKGTAASGNPWGSPRAWERALRLCSAILSAGESDESDLFVEALIGNVGEGVANGYMGIRKVRKHLPSLSEILSDPKGAKTPHDAATCCASLGIIAQVALQDPCAAWVYADRLPQDEFRAAAGRTLLARPIASKKASPHYSIAERARAKILGMVGANMGGA